MRFFKLFGRRTARERAQSPVISLPFPASAQGRVRSRETDGDVCIDQQRRPGGIQVVSDLHCERWAYERLRQLQHEREGQHLLLVGDIGDLRDPQMEQALQEVLSSYDTVMLIPGNHEFYRSSFEDTIAAGKRLEQALGTRFAFMHRKRVDLDNGDTTVLGCTLHSDIPADAIKLTNDFAKIHNWTHARHNEEHNNDREWLQSALADVHREYGHSPRRVIVATHYPPTFEGTSHPHVDPDYRFCFASNTLGEAQSWLGFNLIEWWVSGHTHYNYLISHKSGPRLLSNQPDDGQCKRLYDVRTSI